MYFRVRKQTNKKSSLSEHPSPFMASGQHSPTVITAVCAFREGDNCENWVAAHQVHILLWRISEASCIPSYSNWVWASRSLVKQKKLMGLLFLKEGGKKLGVWEERIQIGCQWWEEACHTSLGSLGREKVTCLGGDLEWDQWEGLLLGIWPQDIVICTVTGMWTAQGWALVQGHPQS